MDENNNFIEEILNYLGYKKVSNDNVEVNHKESSTESYCKIDKSGGANSNCCKDVNLDMPNGFQDIDPVLFLVVGELIGNVIAGNVPFNVANAISNYLNLIGQIIETYAVQQAYFQDGPGRFYDKAYKNVNNPFMSCVKKETCEVNNDNKCCNKDDIYKKINYLEQSLISIKELFSHDIENINLEIDKLKK